MKEILFILLIVVTGTRGNFELPLVAKAFVEWRAEMGYGTT